MLCLQWFICLGVTIALSILGGWHLYLISVSETTIEFYTNKRDARRLKKEGKVTTTPAIPRFELQKIFFLLRVNIKTFLQVTNSIQ